MALLYNCDSISGLAIIDACHLADCLGGETNNLEKDLEAYDLRRYSKLWQLHHISNIAQSFGHMESENLCDFRNNIMTSSVVPKTLKGYAFDQFIQLVASVPVTLR